MNAKVYNDMLLDLATFNFIPKEQINEKVREVLGMEEDTFEEDTENGDQKSNDKTRRLRRRVLSTDAEIGQLKDDGDSIEEVDEEDGPLISHQTE